MIMPIMIGKEGREGGRETEMEERGGRERGRGEPLSLRLR